MYSSEVAAVIKIINAVNAGLYLEWYVYYEKPTSHLQLYTVYCL